MSMSPSQRMQEKVVLVAGAGSGIGRATALRLAAEGAVVASTDLDAAAAEATAAALPAAQRANVPPALDVTVEPQWIAAFDALLARHGRVDALVNSAGISRAAPIAETTLEEWRRVFQINVDGAFLGTKHAIRAMRRGAGGSIVNVSSAAGRHAVPGASAYCAAKAAVCMLSRTAARECRQAGAAIRVNALCPGGVRTPLWRTLPFFRELVEQLGSEDAAFRAVAGKGPGARLAEPDEIAAAILYLTSDDSRFVTGAEFAIDDGWMP